MIRIEKFVLGMLGTNCYLAGNGKELVIIDPADCPDYMIGHIKSNGYLPKAVLLTHGHFDHIGGVKKCAEQFQIPVYAHEAEQGLLEDADLNLSSSYGTPCTLKQVSYVRDGDLLTLAGHTFQVIHTPGHTGGGCCYYVKEEHVLFSGDTMFKASVGRTDFPTGDETMLVKSIREKLLTLPEETRVYPGHMQETSIQEEKLCNPCA